ncbi:hypothetical protein E2C01_009537 [Portunus trituberculatus]|uniref:Uncharacterized protein n=1 Tax=Portunus trituberculatus TaxID=210409 RepID=A0A5B7D628_PORTR|nr:hypothetical protein [Portunus trituberculatus]
MAAALRMCASTRLGRLLRFESRERHGNWESLLACSPCSPSNVNTGSRLGRSVAGSGIGAFTPKLTHRQVSEFLPDSVFLTCLLLRLLKVRPSDCLSCWSISPECLVPGDACEVSFPSGCNSMQEGSSPRVSGTSAVRFKVS